MRLLFAFAFFAFIGLVESGAAQAQSESSAELQGMGTPDEVLDERAGLRPPHVGAKRYRIDHVAPGAPTSEGNGVMHFGDIWHEVKREDFTCSEAEAEVFADEQSACVDRLWDRYDPEGYARGQDLQAAYEACLAAGTPEEVCRADREAELARRLSAFAESCAESAVCAAQLSACSDGVLSCRETWTEWLHFDERSFELPCRPFDYMQWQDRRVRDDWRWDRGIWDRIVKVRNRGFVGDPGLADYVNLEGKPMTVRVRRGQVNADGAPLLIGSYFFGDYRYGQIAFSTFEEPQGEVLVTIPDDYKDAGFYRHAWLRDLYVCEESFTQEEQEALLVKWGYLSKEQAEDEYTEYEPGY